MNIDVAGAQIPIGDAANGLCGGMVFTVRDYFEGGVPVPPDIQAPSSGPLFDYMVTRLFDSFNLPAGPLRYMELMNPTLPDHETVMSGLGLAPRGRAWHMIRIEWPTIQADLDAGYLSPMALVQVKSLDPFQLGKNHQVLAYGYDLNGDDLSIHIYDPNCPNRDNIRLSLNIGDPGHTTAVSYTTGATIWCFFRPQYSFSSPPTVALPRGIGDHFYTTGALERDNAVANVGYRDEGIACYVFDQPAAGTLPLFRMVSANTGDHFYMTGTVERDNAAAYAGYIDEGTACYVFDQPAAGTVPLYRAWNGGNGDHFYTTSVAEKDNAVAYAGYSDEGVACYVFDQQAAGTVPFYRMVKVA
jgi:hypothetical protein